MYLNQKELFHALPQDRFTSFPSIFRKISHNVRRHQTPEHHRNPKGEGDARPTAIQIVQDQGLTGSMIGKVMIVTDATSGIGVETARALHTTGADVFIAGRDMAKAEEVANDIKSDKGPGKVEVLKVELDNFASIKDAANEFLSRSSALHVLVNNAGVMACPEGKTKDGFETQFGTNHLGHFLLFQLLKPTLIASSTPEFNSRVVSVSSIGHRSRPLNLDDIEQKSSGYDKWIAYSYSKTSNIYFATELDRRYCKHGLHGFSLNPGGIMTSLTRHLPAAWREAATKDSGFRNFAKSAEQGAATSVWAAIAKELEGKGGMYLEDCQESVPVKENNVTSDLGYKPWAFDKEREGKLWEMSLKMVGLSDDQ